MAATPEAPGPSPPLAPPTTQKEAAELEKLRAEMRKADQDVRSSRKSFWLELAKALGALGVLLGIFATFYAQRQQMRLAQSQGADQAFMELVRQIGSEGPVAKLSAAAGLEQYLTPGYEAYQPRTAQLLVRSIELEENPRLRAFIRGALVRNASSVVVSTLREQNLELQSELASALNVPVEAFVLWEKPFTTALPAQAGPAVRNLEWNVDTLLAALNNLAAAKGEIAGLDLSRIVLSLPPVDIVESRGFTAHELNIPRPRAGMVLRDVDLSGAKLSWLAFEDCRLVNVKLSRAVMAGTSFRRCQFEGQTEMDELRSWLVGEYLAFVHPVTFTECSLAVASFGLDLSVPLGATEAISPRRVFLLMEDSAWQIARLPAGLESRFLLVQRSEVQEGGRTRRLRREAALQQGEEQKVSGRWEGVEKGEKNPAGGLRPPPSPKIQPRPQP